MVIGEKTVVMNSGPIDQACFAMLLIGSAPSIKAAFANAKIPTGFYYRTELFSIVQNTKIAMNLALIEFSDKQSAKLRKDVLLHRAEPAACLAVTFPFSLPAIESIRRNIPQ